VPPMMPMRVGSPLLAGSAAATPSAVPLAVASAGTAATVRAGALYGNGGPSWVRMPERLNP